jgi:hypothetical protein
MCLLVLPKDLSLGFTYLFVTVLCSSVKHSKYCLFGDTIKIARPLYSVAVRSLPQSEIDSICGWCAANGMKFNTDETKVRSTILTTYCLNLWKCCDSYVLCPSLFLLLIVPYCYITPYCKLATDGTLPQSNMDSVHVWYAADLILTKLKSKHLQEKLMHFTIFTNCVINI